jgi:predicted dienelactone hydrolase
MSLTNNKTKPQWHVLIAAMALILSSPGSEARARESSSSKVGTAFADTNSVSPSIETVSFNDEQSTAKTESDYLIAETATARSTTSPTGSETAGSEKSDYRTGYTVLTDEFAYREQPVPFKIAVWYPTSQSAGNAYYPIGSNKIATKVVKDAPVAEGKFPVIFYSHGATGAGTSSFFICELLASHGFIVIAPDYLDTVYVARIDQPVPFDGYLWMRTAQYISWLRELGLNKASKEGRELFAYRPIQLKQTIKMAFELNEETKSLLHQHLDEKRIGLFGHSFGAWTSVLLAGASPVYHDDRIKAVAALSGPVNEFVYSVASENDLNKVKAPILFEYGDKEPASGRQDDKKFLFDKASTPKILLSIKNADHLSFSGGVKGEHKTASEFLNQDPPRKVISETTLDFFDAYLKGNQSSKAKLKTRTDGIASSFVEF